MTEQALLQLRNVSVQQGSNTLLSNINLSLSRGQIMTVIGPNGAGKSTLLRVALGLRNCDRGEVQRRPHLRVGYMPQKLSLNPLIPISVSRFLRMANNRRTSIKDALQRAGISHLADRPLHDISGGETQRVPVGAGVARVEVLQVGPVHGNSVQEVEGWEVVDTELKESLFDILVSANLQANHSARWVDVAGRGQ
ncbi:MAG: ATP-binding cassette domain-containing protein, partial [Spongiibacter sp.]